MKKILFVIDMQNDFLTGPLGNKECAETVDPVVKLIKSEKWDHVIYTRDTHLDNYFETLEGKKLPVKHCIKGSDGWEIQDDVSNATADIENVSIINKRTFGSNVLPNFIKFNDEFDKPEDFEIHICGVCTSICVLSNAAILRANFRNTPIYIHRNATADVTPELKEHALACLQSIQCDIVD